MVLSQKVNKLLRKGDCLALFHLYLLFFITESIQSKFKVYIFQSFTYMPAAMLSTFLPSVLLIGLKLLNCNV